VGSIAVTRPTNQPDRCTAECRQSLPGGELVEPDPIHEPVGGIDQRDGDVVGVWFAGDALDRQQAGVSSAHDKRRWLTE
jgi:hypothetical protein